MPLKLSEFLKKEKQITVKHEGESVVVSFRVNAFNSEFVDAYYRKDWNKEHPDENRLDAQLKDLILSWNIVDDEEQPVEPSMELIRMLPLGLKKKLGAEMMREMQGPGPEEKKH